ncbi:MAG: endosialidase [Lachnospiraceae bacterium]|nr:endosialidase [Lachnospiraceae bacterium]
MAVIDELIREETDGTLSFGNYQLPEKKKKGDFMHQGASYKVKTFKEITKLEKNENFVYESVPGTTVNHLAISDDKATFSVEGPEDAQITLGMEAEKDYDITVNGKDAGTMKTNLGGKLSFGVELDGKNAVSVSVTAR